MSKNSVQNKSDFERCKKYKPKVDRVCEFGLVDRFLWCAGCNHFVQPDHPGLKMQREADRDHILSLLGQFPPYHGQSFNYTKQEVEDWLEKARSTFMLKQIGESGTGVGDGSNPKKCLNLPKERQQSTPKDTSVQKDKEA